MAREAVTAPDGTEVRPLTLDGKPVLLVTRPGYVAYVPVRLREEGGRLLLADVTLRRLTECGVDITALA